MAASKLDDAVIDALAEAISRGVTVKVACAAADISPTTYHTWMKRARTAKTGLYRRFGDAMETARAKMVAHMAQVVIDAATEDGVTRKSSYKEYLDGRPGVRTVETIRTKAYGRKAANARFMLKVHDPDTYGDRTKVEQSGRVAVDHHVPRKVTLIIREPEPITDLEADAGASRG